MRSVTSILVAGAAFATLSSPVCALVITPMEVFANCSIAKEFRDKELPKKLDTEFRRYQTGVQARIDEIVKDFANSVQKSKVDYANFSEAQKKEVLVASGKFFTGLVIKKFAANMKGPYQDSYNKLSNADKRIVDAIGDKTNGLGDLTFDAIRGKKIDTADVIRPYADGLIELLSWSFGPLSKGIVEGAKGTIDIGGAYLEHKPDKDFAEQQIEFWKKSLEKMVINSPEFRTRVINNTKLVIDKACGT